MPTERRPGGNRSAKEVLEELDGPLTFGRMLNGFRLSEEASLADFAKKLGVSRQHLCDVEQGRRSVSIERAAAWARALGYGEGQFMELALEQQARAAGLDVQITVRPRARAPRQRRRADGSATKKRASR